MCSEFYKRVMRNVMLTTDKTLSRQKHLPYECEEWSSLLSTHSKARQAEQLPLIPGLERQMQEPPSKLLSQSSHIGELWVHLRDLVSGDKVESN